MVENGLSFGAASGTERDDRIPWCLPQPLPRTGSSSCISLRAAWESVVRDYTGRSLTYEQDRIPAMAGIIRHFELALGDEPILGLLEKDLCP